MAIDRYIGLCRAAGGVVIGTDSVLTEIRRGRAKFILIAADASERTKKQLSDKCTFYEVKYYTAEFDSAAMARLLGKPCVAAAFNGKGPWKCVRDALEPPAASGDVSPVPKSEEDSCDDRKDD